MKRFSLGPRLAFVGAVVGGLAGISAITSSAQATTCRTEGELTEVRAGTANADVDVPPYGLAAFGQATVCVDAAGTGAEASSHGYDGLGNWINTGAHACVASGATVNPCSAGNTALVGVGWAREDQPRVGVSPTGAAVTAFGGTQRPAFNVIVNDTSVFQDVPRQCVEVGTGSCSTASPVLP